MLAAPTMAQVMRIERMRIFRSTGLTLLVSIPSSPYAPSNGTSVLVDVSRVLRLGLHARVSSPQSFNLRQDLPAMDWAKYDLLDSSQNPPVQIWPVRYWDKVSLVSSTRAGPRLPEVIGSAAAGSQPQPAFCVLSVEVGGNLSAAVYRTFVHLILLQLNHSPVFR